MVTKQNLPVVNVHCKCRYKALNYCNFTYMFGYIDDALSINNPTEGEIKEKIESNASASYLDLFLSIGKDFAIQFTTIVTITISILPTLQA